ncbi:MAG: M20/M25/M40 family metallo-hydrolase [Propionibacteriaceae bacterium]|jgi:acetylornithine deacetylase/succinyl-diaminopimelate desuccinylase-like protein|nr:M20/M25/M40 family metallo-hydrolase [Propionibacteriaceae bacterium]
MMDRAALGLDSGDELVIAVLRRLIRFAAVNYGDGVSDGELPTANWVAEVLRASGYEPQILARDDAPERANVVLRIPGRDRALPAVLIHGHLDVVPVEASEWSVDPFAGEIVDGYVTGRGSVDMLDTVATMLATAVEWADEGVTPTRDVVMAFVADEEAGGDYGADWLVRNHAALFAGCAVAVGEDGAQFTPVPAPDGREVRLYPIACAERGAMHSLLHVTGPAGHGSRPTRDNAVAKLVAALNRIAEYRWPLQVSPVVAAQLQASATALGLDVDLDDERSIAAVVAALGPAAGALGFTTRVSAALTVLKAGYKVNVIPGYAEARVDVRYPPGAYKTTLAAMNELIGDEVTWEFPEWGEPPESDPNSEWFAAMRAAIVAADPAAVVVPYCMGGSTDGRAFATLGMQAFGFTPLTQAPGGRLPTHIHVANERNPVDGIVGGHAIMRAFLEA